MYSKDKIDMVYLWCDGNDPDFKKRKSQFLVKDSNDEEVVGDKRFFDNEELKYSLRSLEKNVPWINHVYIVTDRQIPKWLNLNYFKVTVVDHSEIMPNEIIPCFNSSVIEYFIANIPNLSEKFLYACDDMFFGKELPPESFFEGDKPIVRGKLSTKFISIKEANQCLSNDTLYEKSLLNAYKLLVAKYNISENDNFYFAHHNIDAYTKSLYNNIIKDFEKYLCLTYKNRFRSDNDISRILINFGMVYKNMAVLKIVKDPKPWRRFLHNILNVEWESYLDDDANKNIEKELLEYEHSFFCINSGGDCSYERKFKIKQLMEKLFPEPSKFEK